MANIGVSYCCRYLDLDDMCTSVLEQSPVADYVGVTYLKDIGCFSSLLQSLLLKLAVQKYM